MTNIGENAFEGSTNVASIIIPASVTSIGEYGLSGCFNLTAAYFLGNAPSADYTVFNGDPGSDNAALSRVRYTIRRGKLIFGKAPADGAK